MQQLAEWWQLEQILALHLARLPGGGILWHLGMRISVLGPLGRGRMRRMWHR